MLTNTRTTLIALAAAVALSLTGLAGTASAVKPASPLAKPAVKPQAKPKRSTSVIKKLGTGSTARDNNSDYGAHPTTNDADQVETCAMYNEILQSEAEDANEAFEAGDLNAFNQIFQNLDNWEGDAMDAGCMISYNPIPED